jgi:branched-subunit amino acid aminotransferase/4-amino-4-deoxychorismate lyase
MTPTFVERLELNGLPARIEDLRSLMQTNYGHFSAMRVEDGSVRGLDLHIERLAASTRELFGTALDRERLRGYLRHAIADEIRALSLRVNIFSRALDREHLARPVEPDVLVLASEARPVSVTPLRVKSFDYARDPAMIKHVGTFPLFYHRRLAQQAGFDDAVFADAAGTISEGSIWNIGFIDDHGVVWPDAPQLTGVSMQLLQAGLASAGMSSTSRPIRLDDLGKYRAAFFTNASVPVRPIACIDDIEFVIDDEFVAMLLRCYESNSPQRP